MSWVTLRNLAKKWRYSVIFLDLLFMALLSVRSAEAILPRCLNEGQPLNLKLYSPARSLLKDPVSVNFTLNGNILTASFQVRTPTIYAKKPLGPKEFPYQFDVVELFISVKGEASKYLPYVEYELTPHNQTFQVLVRDPRKPFENNVDKGLMSSAEFVPGGWKAEMKIDLTRLEWNGDPRMIFGNAYSVLGKKGARSYWSLYPLVQLPKPNFHQPAMFKEIFPSANCLQ